MEQTMQRQCIALIEKYKQMPILWNSKDPQYRNKIKRENAWRSISADLSVPVSALKAKMRSLMGTYRSERSRENKSRNATTGPEDGYVSKWFAYSHFNFLVVKNEQIKTYEASTPDMALDDLKEEDSPLSSSTEEDLFPVHARPLFSNSTKKISPQKRKRQDDDHERKSLNVALEVLKLSKDQSLDPLYLYGLNLANELRKYDALTLAHVKKAISDILFEADVGTIRLRNTDMNSQPAHCSHPPVTSNPVAHCVAQLGPSSAIQSPAHDAKPVILSTEDPPE